MTIERFPVEGSHVMMFARAIGDPNPAYVDTGGEAPFAPPTFVQSGAQFDADYFLRPRPGEPWFGSGREATGAAIEPSGVLHAEQMYEYHQPVRVGMVLAATEREGEAWEKQSARAGPLRFNERIVEYRDVSTGELVVTARAVGVKTERPVDKEA